MSEIKLTDKVQKTILDRLADGEALNAICADPKIPVAESTVRKRALEDEGFGAKYAHARMIGYLCQGERIVAGTKTEEAKENPQAARLIFDAERWHLSKMLPKVFGDKLDLTSGGEKIGLSAEVEAARRRQADA
jgi:hypothetical protein